MPDVSPTGQLPPDLARGLTMPRVSRRRALQLGGLSALGLALTACSIPGAKSSKLGLNAARQEIKKFWLAQAKTGSLRFANWPLYIDVDAKNQSLHPSLELFKKQTGIKVTYSEDIQDNASFFGKVQPQLSAGQDIGFDIIVITNGLYLDKLMQLDYLLPLDQTRMSNFYANSSSLVRDASFDRGNVYTMAWQSGMTGIGYDSKRVGHEITSWEDLQDPALKGKIGMFGDTADLPNAALCAIGVNPETSTEADWVKAADWLKRQRPLVRKYYDQGYAAALAKGDIWASMAYSGDIFQANASGADLKFAVPKEGASIWTDNMCIPAHAKHPLDAMTYMDWVYQPEVAAMLAEGIDYITPVPAVADVMRKQASALTGTDRTDLLSLASDPLVFPRPEDYARLHRFRVLAPTEEKRWNALFEPIFQS